MNPRRFRIALSFAGEKRDFVEQVADLLAQRFGRDQILYDKYHEAEFARGDLGIYLPRLYGEESDLIVPVLCPNYDPKRWTGWEWLYIYSLMTKTDMKRVMPSRFGFAHADGLSPAAGFIELDHKTPAQFVALILQRLALNEGKPSDFYWQAASEPQQSVIADAPAPESSLHRKDSAMSTIQRTIVRFDLVQSTSLAGLIGEAVDEEARTRLKSKVLDFVGPALEHAGFNPVPADAMFSLDHPWYKWEGDGAFLQFEVADAACKFALEFQALAEQRASAQVHGPIRFRIGIATGPVTASELMKRLELEGDALAYAARVEPKCTVGAVLIHESTVQALSNDWQWHVGQPIEIQGKLHEPLFRAYELVGRLNGNGGLPRSETEIRDRIAERLGRVQRSSDWFKQLAVELESLRAGAPSLPRPIEVSALAGWVKLAALSELRAYFHALDKTAAPSDEADRQLALELLVLAAVRHIDFTQVPHPVDVGTGQNARASFLNIPVLSHVLAGVCAAARMGLQIHVGSHAAVAGTVVVSIPRRRAEFDTLLLGELYLALLQTKFDPTVIGSVTDSSRDRDDRVERAWRPVKTHLEGLRFKGRFVALCLRFQDMDTDEQRDLVLKEVARACDSLVIGLRDRDQGLVNGLPPGHLASWIEDLLRRIAPDR
ncbi:MAG: hypothetical protein JNN30_05620 [Rhodanobacteraceae bacterium]|nr:hypothetical protein [Rhodanobacteraceae bacterium]